MEEKQFCVDFFGDLNKNEERNFINPWYDQFSKQFSLKFPHIQTIPSAKTVTYVRNKFKKFNTVENRKSLSQSNVCDECGFVGNGRPQDIHYHKKSAHEKEKCTDCGKLISSKNFATHKQTHLPESERKYKCSFCGKGFLTNQKLSEHELIHTDERPFSCKFLCGYSCKSSANIRKHEKICGKR